LPLLFAIPKRWAAIDRLPEFRPGSGRAQACHWCSRSCWLSLLLVLFSTGQKGVAALFLGPEICWGFAACLLLVGGQAWPPLMQARRQQPLKDLASG